jgi:nucleoid-associated protein YgaU
VKNLVLILTAIAVMIPAFASAQDWDTIIKEIDTMKAETGKSTEELSAMMIDEGAALSKEAEGLEFENKALEGKIMKVKKVQDWWKGIIAEDQKYLEGTPGGRHIVVEGECLWMIAGMEYGHPYYYKWPLIYDANRDLIKDPDLIYPGWELVIPGMQ